MNRTRKTAAVAVGFLVAAGLNGGTLAGTAAAHPTQVHVATPNAVTMHTFACGDTVELTVGSTVKLDADVGPCPVGLVVGALTVTGDRGTLDLNGHVIRGTDTTTDCFTKADNNDENDETGDGAGIYVSNAVGVTITNSADDLDYIFDEDGLEGGVTGFDAGIAIDGGANNTVTHLSVHKNKGPGELPTEFGEGIVVRGSEGNTIGGSSTTAANVVTCNGPYGGITLYGATNNLVRYNKVKDNAVPEEGHVLMQDDGIRLENGSNGNTIRNNTVMGSGLDGIAVLNPGSLNTIEENEVSSSGRHGIAIFGRENIIRNNTVSSSDQDPAFTGYDLFDSGSACDNSWSGHDSGDSRNHVNSCIS